jgi:hypothetical protein
MARATFKSLLKEKRRLLREEQALEKRREHHSKRAAEFGYNRVRMQELAMSLNQADDEFYKASAEIDHINSNEETR